MLPSNHDCLRLTTKRKRRLYSAFHKLSLWPFWNHSLLKIKETAAYRVKRDINNRFGRVGTILCEKQKKPRRIVLTKYQPLCPLMRYHIWRFSPPELLDPSGTKDSPPLI